MCRPGDASPHTLAIRSAMSRKSLQRVVLERARYSSISRCPMLYPLQPKHKSHISGGPSPGKGTVQQIHASRRVARPAQAGARSHLVQLLVDLLHVLIVRDKLPHY